MGFTIRLAGVAHDVEILARRPHLRLRIDDREYEVTLTGDEDDGWQTVEVSGRPLRFARAHLGDRQILRFGGRTFEASLIDPRDHGEGGAGDYDQVRAPMPGAIVEIHKQSGDVVVRGDTLVTIESMKLQIALVAPRDGRLRAVTRAVGETFDRDEIVAELEPPGRG
jgi:acetyl/propionyl-CoA carboxylase alpha subunit